MAASRAAEMVVKSVTQIQEVSGEEELEGLMREAATSAALVAAQAAVAAIAGLLFLHA